MTKFLPILVFALFGLSGLRAQTDKELQIEFIEIDSLEYSEYKKQYVNPMVPDSTKHTREDSAFSLTINNKEQYFECQTAHAPCYYYKGFLPMLESHVITHCSKYYCETFLLNENTGERHHLYSPYDSEAAPPLLSKDHTKILVFASNVFETESVISVYDSQKGPHNFDYNSFESFATNDWKIYEAVWIDGTSFALKTFQKYGGTTGDDLLEVGYLKGIIK